ncbi:MAG TPA: hypothetical protein VLW52_06430 [Opitutaceae bacterium]|nr:hypothetical protein [Opitutaceae bacterium]
MRTLRFTAFLSVLAAVSFGEAAPDKCALRFSTLPLPKSAKIVDIEMTLQKCGTVVFHDIPAGWLVTSETWEEGRRDIQIAMNLIKLDRIAKPYPIEPQALDHTVLVSLYTLDPNRPDVPISPQEARKLLKVHGRVEYLLPGEKAGRSLEFGDAEIGRDYFDQEDQPNQTAEPTRTTVTPPAGAGDRASGARGSP